MEEVIILEAHKDADKIFPNRKIRLIKVGQKRISVVRLQNDFYAFDNNCPHLDYPLSEGIINPTGRVICPWHNYSFNLLTGQESELRCKSLKCYTINRNEKGQLILMV